MAAGSNIDIIIQLKDLASKQLGALENSLKGISGTVLSLKEAFAGLSAGFALQEITNQFTQFDDMMRQVGAVASATTDEFKALTDQAKLMGETTRFTAMESAEALRNLAMGGLTANDAFNALPGVLNLASAGATDLATAAEIATNVMSGMGLAVSDLNHINDLLVTTSVSSNAAVTDLGEAFKTAAPAAKASGVSLEEISVVLGALANRGIKGSEAGNNVKRMLIALQSPTASAKVELEKLGVVTTTADGKFRGLIPVLEDLGKAQMDITGASEIFGLYSASAAVAASGASKDFDRLSDAMKNASGSAEQIAKQMEAGIGGAFRTLESTWEALKISLGEGLGQTVMSAFQFFTKEIGNAIIAIEAFKSSGQLSGWADSFKGLIYEVYKNLKNLASIFFAVIDALEPLIKLFIEFLPEIRTFYVVTILASKSISVFQGGLLLAGQAMSRFTQLSMFLTTHIATIPAHFATMSIAGSLLATTMLGLAAAFGAFKIIQLAMIAVEQVSIWAKNKADAEGYIGILDRTIEKYKEYANIEMPDNLSGQSKESLEQLNSELKKSAVYWETYLDKLRANYDGSQKSAQAIKDVENKLQLVKMKLNDVKEAISGYKDETQKALEAANKAHTNHLTLITELSKKMVRDEIENRDKLVKAQKESYDKQGVDLQAFRESQKAGLDDALNKEKANYEAGKTSYADYILAKENILSGAAAKEAEFIKNNTQNYETYEAKRLATIEASEEKIRQIKLQIAQQIQDTEKESIALAQANYQEELRLLDAEYAGKKEKDQEYFDKKKLLTFDYETQIAEISKTVSNAVDNQKLADAKAAADKYLEIAEDKNEREQAAFDIHMKELDLLIAKGAMTQEEADKKKEEMSRQFYENQYKNAVAGFELVKGVYGSDKDEFGKALKIKEQALLKFQDMQIEQAKKQSKSLSELAKDFDAAWSKSINNVGDRNAEIDKQLEEEKNLKIETEEAEKKLGTITQQLDGVVIKVEGPYSMGIDEDPTIAAFKRLAEAALATATAAKQSIITLQEDVKGLTGEMAYVARANLAQLQRDYDKAIDKAETYKKEISKNTKATVEFTGKASPEKPLTETINDVTQKLDIMTKTIVEPKGFEVFFQDMGIKDGLYDISTLFDRSKVSAKDAGAYITTAMNEATANISSGVDPVSIAAPYREAGLMISQEMAAMGTQTKEQFKSMQDSLYNLGQVMNQPILDSSNFLAEQTLNEELKQQRFGYEDSMNQTVDTLKQTISGIRDNTLQVNQQMINDLVSRTQNIMTELGAGSGTLNNIFKNSVNETNGLLEILYQKIESTPALNIDVSQAKNALEQIRQDAESINNTSLLNWNGPRGGIANTTKFDKSISKELTTELSKNFLDMDIMKMKDLGEVQINVGHNGFPVFMSPDAAKQLQDTIRREGLIS